MHLAFSSYPNKFLLLLFCMLTVSITHGQGTKILHIKGPSNENLNSYYTSFADSSGLLTVKEAFNKLKAGKFRAEHNAKVFNRGITTCTYWLAVYVHNDTTLNLPIVWSFYNNSISFSLYDATDPGNIKLIDSSSSSQPLLKRKLPVRSISFRVELPARQTKLLMVRVFANNTSNIYFPTDLTTTDDYLLYEVNYSFLIGRYIGYFLFAFVFNLMLWVALRNRIHLWHAAYVLALIGFNLNEFMVDSYVFPDWFFQYWSYLPKSIFLLIPIYLGMNVLRIFINQKTDFKVFYHIFKIYQWVLLALIAVLIVSAYILSPHHIIASAARSVANFMALTGVALMLCNMIAGIIRRHYYTIIYTISSLFLLIALVDFLLNTLEMGQLFFIQPGNIIVAFTFEILVLTVIFVFKYRKEKNNSIMALRDTITIRGNWLREITKVQESERERISKDLHDDVGATLGALKFHLSAKRSWFKDKDLKFYEDSISLIDKATSDIRSISHGLVPLDFTHAGLFAILTDRIQKLNQQDEIVFSLIIEGDENIINDTTTAIIVYRIVNELINNISKHSQASIATIQLSVLPDAIQVIIEDNGIGMEHSVNKKGIGLTNIASRVEYLNGTIFFDSNDKGTTVIINIPPLGSI